MHDRRIHVIQGEYRVSGDPHVVFATLLGSCVAACIRDPVAGVGGINHFLLPGVDGARAQEGERYGVHLMELLVNGLMKLGAQRDRLEAKLFGGAKVVHGLSDIGRKNSAFAERFLDYEGVRVIGKDVGGVRGRRLQFWPCSGRARLSYVASGVARDVAPASVASAAPLVGDVELF